MNKLSMNKSVWGSGDAITLDAIKELKPTGTWLVLGAGDGRYIAELLETVDCLMVTDINETLLNELSVTYAADTRLRFKKADITLPLPFEEGSFDGVFCTGTLHLFAPDVLERTLKAIDQVLKADGVLFFDIATDIERVFTRDVPGKRQETLMLYSSETAARIIPELIPHYDLQVRKSSFLDDLSEIQDFYCVTKGNFLLFFGTKRI